MAAIPKRRWTAEEYLAFERTSEEKHEFIDGEVYLMSGGSRNHSVIATTIIIKLGAQLETRPCTIFSSDMRIGLGTTENYTYPDVAVVCGPEEIEKDHQDILLNPTLIIEVLSPSTEKYDRGRKFQLYRTLSSLQEYVLISQDAPNIEKFLRQPNGEWTFSEATGIEATVALPSIGCTLLLSDVFDKVTFDSTPES